MIGTTLWSLCNDNQHRLSVLVLRGLYLPVKGRQTWPQPIIRNRFWSKKYPFSINCCVDNLRHQSLSWLYIWLFSYLITYFWYTYISIIFASMISTSAMLLYVDWKSYKNIWYCHCNCHCHCTTAAATRQIPEAKKLSWSGYNSLTKIDWFISFNPVKSLKHISVLP